MAKEDSRLVVTFESHAVHNETLSREKGRPVFDDMEICRIRMAGDRQNAPAFPAWAEAPGGVEDEDGFVRPGTYAEKYADQYARFKKGQAQTQDGTPVDQLPFLTKAKREELKRLNIYTAESLAALDGQNLKTLGQDGRDWKNQAQAYIDNASGSAAATRQSLEIEALRKELAELKKDRAQFIAEPAPVAPVPEAEKDTPSDYEDFTDEDLKTYIKEATGVAPKGNPNHATLVRMAQELDDQNK